VQAAPGIALAMQIRRRRLRVTKAWSVRKSLIAVVVLEAVAALQIAYYWPKLPATVASHFDMAGMANSWEPKQLFLELYAVVMLCIAAAYFVIPHLIFSLPPELINVPNKAYWLAPQRRAETMEFFVDHFAILGAGTLALAVTIFQLAVAANLAPTPALSNPVSFGLLAAYFVFVGIWLVILFVRFRRV
jgi:uncharacterized membrane protein